MSNKGQQHDGRTSHPLYLVYRSMKGRCYTPTHTSYKNYGAKGVTVAPRWLEKPDGFWNFIEDMGPRPEGHSLDRIDPSLGYAPENCRWANGYMQGANKRECKNRHGVIGIRSIGQKFQAYYNNPKILSLGTYPTLEEAKSVRDRLERASDPREEAKLIQEEFEVHRLRRSSGWKTPKGRWQISSTLNGERIHIGTYDTQKEAIERRDEWILKNYPASSRVIKI